MKKLKEKLLKALYVAHRLANTAVDCVLFCTLIGGTALVALSEAHKGAGFTLVFLSVILGMYVASYRMDRATSALRAMTRSLDVYLESQQEEQAPEIEINLGAADKEQ